MNPETANMVARELQLLYSDRENVEFHGLSMEPILKDGDLVILEAASLDDIKVGDIITYRYKELYPTRRVVSLKKNQMYLWCDNWPHLRFVADQYDILGRVTGRIRAKNILMTSDPQWQQQTKIAMINYKRSTYRYWFRRMRRTAARHIFGRAPVNRLD